jgi:hypothetical protein
LVDTVVVYKVDRLTRSLTEFARMVELFDAKRRAASAPSTALISHCGRSHRSGKRDSG